MLGMYAADGVLQGVGHLVGAAGRVGEADAFGDRVAGWGKAGVVHRRLCEDMLEVVDVVVIVVRGCGVAGGRCCFVGGGR